MQTKESPSTVFAGYPWDDGPGLCPVLEQPDLWRKVLGRCRKAVKAACRKVKYPSFHIDHEESFCQAVLCLLKRPWKRKELIKIIERETPVPLYNHLYSYLRSTHKSSIPEMEEVCDLQRSEGEFHYLAPERFRAWLEKRRPSGEDCRTLALFGCAFAMLQPAAAAEILGVLVEFDPIYRPLLGRENPPPQDGLSPGAAIAGDSCEEEDSSEEFDPDLDSVSETEWEIPPNQEEDSEQQAAASQRTGNAVPDAAGDDPAVPADDTTFEWFGIASLGAGKAVIDRFLTAWADFEEAAKHLPQRIDGQDVAGEDSDEGALAGVAAILGGMRQSARQTHDLLRSLMRALESGEIHREVQRGGLLTTLLQSCSSACNNTFHTLRKAGAEVSRTLAQMAADASEADAHLLACREEIRRADDFLGRAPFQTPVALPTGNFIHALRLRPILEETLAQSQREIHEHLSRLKHEIGSELTSLENRYDLASAAPDIGQELRDLAEQVSLLVEPGALPGIRNRLEALKARLRQHPEIRGVIALAADAERQGCTAAALLALARGLQNRGRHAETLGLLTLLQLTMAMEEADLSDFSELTDLLLRAAATLAAERKLPFAWTDAVIQQPWVRQLSRADLGDTSAWRRLAALLMAQQYLRGAEHESNLFFNLELIKAFPAAQFRCLNRVLHGMISGTVPQLLTTDPFESQTRMEATISRFFHRDERGKYQRQAARGDEFYRMEKEHLFPMLENLWRRVRAACQQRDWPQARQIVEENPDRLFRQACREARIEPDLSDLLRNRAVNEQIGYVPELLRSLREYIAAALEGAHFEDDYLLLSDIHREIGVLTAQDPEFAVFWQTVDQSLGTASTAAHVDSADEAFVRLAGTSPEIALLCPQFIAALCQHDERRYEPALLTGFVRRLQGAAEQEALLELEAALCLKHAIKTVDFLLAKTDQPSQVSGNTGISLEQYRRQLGERERAYTEDFHARWSVIEHFAPPFSGAEFNQYLELGHYSFIQREFTKIEGEINRRRQHERDDTDAWLKLTLAKLSAIQDGVDLADFSDGWQDQVRPYCAKIELKLRRARTEFTRNSQLGLSRDAVDRAMSALDFMVSNGTRDFVEIEVYIRELDGLSPAPAVERSGELSPAIAEPWRALRNKDRDERNREKVDPRWHELAHAFAKICGLYYDVDKKKTMTFADLKSYPWGYFVTRFYTPRSHYLNREICLYLCLGDTLTEEQAEALSFRWHEDPEGLMLHVVLTPCGTENARELLRKHSRQRAEYLLVDEILMKAICGRTNKHHVPLRQALHRSVDDFTSLGLFKSDGYVHESNNIFVGRKDALRQIIQQPASAIWGGRRTGKTSLMHAIKTRLENPASGAKRYEVALIYADAASEDDPDLIVARDILAQLKLPRPGSIDEFHEILSAAIRDRPIAVLIDEADAYIATSRLAHGEGEFPLARKLRALTQTDRQQHFKLVYAGFKQLYYECELNPTSQTSYPFKQFLQSVTKDFRDLNPDEVAELMEISFVEMFGAEIEPGVPRLVWQKTSGHPAFVQRFCERLLGRISQRHKRETALRVTLRDVELTHQESTEKAFIYYVSETLGWNVSFLGRAIFLALSANIREMELRNDAAFTVDQLWNILNYWCDNETHRPSREDFNRTLQMLTMTNMLRQEGLGQAALYRISYPAYIDFMSRLDQLRQFEIFDTLRQYSESERGKIK